MTYKTLMVRMSVNRDNASLLQVAAELSDRLDAHVIGIAAFPAMPQTFSAVQIVCGGIAASENIAEQHRAAAQTQLDEAEAQLRAAMQGHARSVSWRSIVTEEPLDHFLVEESRAADLFITHPLTDPNAKGGPVTISVGEIVMNIGRPVLLVPPCAEHLDLDTALVGWKDTRATRRAVRDALPLLKLAKHVVVGSIATPEGMDEAKIAVEDVAEWLARHGVTDAKGQVLPAKGGDASALASLAQGLNAGLLVAGAYGHARFREWALGGVTQDYLLHPRRLTLISH